MPQLGNGTQEVTHQHRMQVTRKETSRSCWPGRQSWRLSSLLPALTTTRQTVLLWEVSHTGIEAQVAIVPQCLGPSGALSVEGIAIRTVCYPPLRIEVLVFFLLSSVFFFFHFPTHFLSFI